MNFPRDLYNDTDTCTGPLVALFKLLFAEYTGNFRAPLNWRQAIRFFLRRYGTDVDGAGREDREKTREGETAEGWKKINFYKERVSTNEKGKPIPPLTLLIGLARLP